MYFGEPWPSGICDDGQRVDTPAGERCLLCDEPIEADHQGSFVYDETGPRPVHQECSLRMVLGGIGHLEDHHRWCTGEGDPDGGRTYRQSALEVWAWAQSHRP
jgi:hypothetical protein